MSLRRIGRVSRVGTKALLAGGSLYIYYEAGLWKNSDETIQNYDKFKGDVKTLYESTPADVQKWVAYGCDTVKVNAEPYKKAVSDFRKDWLNFDLSFLTEEGDGVLKPTWNKGVSWTCEALKNSPQTVQRWGRVGYQKMSELASEQGQGAGAGASTTQKN